MCRLFPSALIQAISSSGPAGPQAIDIVAQHICGDLNEAGAYREGAWSDVADRARAFAHVAINGTSAQMADGASPPRLSLFTG